MLYLAFNKAHCIIPILTLDFIEDNVTALRITSFLSPFQIILIHLG
jgi:hypothetical protein